MVGLSSAELYTDKEICPDWVDLVKFMSTLQREFDIRFFLLGGGWDLCYPVLIAELNIALLNIGDRPIDISICIKISEPSNIPGRIRQVRF